MAGSLENRGKLRELIDKFQFAKMTTDRKFDIFVTKASISLS